MGGGHPDWLVSPVFARRALREGELCGALRTPSISSAPIAHLPGVVWVPGKPDEVESSARGGL
jgi:hypothetical protein